MDERSTEIIRRFQKSWAETRLFYDKLIDHHGGFDRLKPLRQFILDMIDQGEDQFFRAGTSVYTLVLSRSVDFGLRPDQKYIRIEAFDKGYAIALRDGQTTYRKYQIATLQDERLKKLLLTLKKTLVD